MPPVVSPSCQDSARWPHILQRGLFICLVQKAVTEAGREPCGRHTEVGISVHSPHTPSFPYTWGFPGSCQCGRCRFDPRRRRWHPLRALASEVPWAEEPGGLQSMGSRKSRTRLSDFTFTFHFHSSLSCTGEVNGNPLQCSCLENPRDGGAWGAVVSGVAQGRTRLK